MKDRKQAVFSILMTIGIVMFGLIIFWVGPRNIIFALRSSRISLVALAFTIFVTNIFIRSLKWLSLIWVRGIPTSRKGVVLCYLANVFLGNFTPARSGEIMAPFLLESYCSIPRRYGFSMIILERAIDMAVFFVILLAISTYFYQTLLIPQKILLALQLAVLSCLVIIIGLSVMFFLMIRAKGTALEMALRINEWGRERGGKIGKIIQKAATWMKVLTQAFKEIACWKSVLICLGLSVLTWSGEFIYLFTIVNSITSIGFLHSVCCQSFAISMAILSFIPGGIGVGAAGYLTCAVLLGYPKTAVGSAVVLNACIIHSTRLALGTIALWRLRSKRKKTVLKSNKLSTSSFC